MNKKPPSREKLNEAVEKILNDYPIANLSLNRILKLLEAKFVVPLSESVDNVKLAIAQSSQFHQFQSLHMSFNEVSYDILMASVWPNSVGMVHLLTLLIAIALTNLQIIIKSQLEAVLLR